jgi:hypothetical protein
MRQVRIAVLLAMAYAMSACAPHGASEPGPTPPDDTQSAGSASPRGTPSPGKPTAPVVVSADIQDRRALVTVVVAREGRDLEVKVHGIDGITVVTPTAPLRAATARAGEKITLDVSFSSATPSPSGTLVVEVEGTFAGRKLGGVRSFSLGQPPAAGPKDPPTTDASGRPVKLLPAD